MDELPKTAAEPGRRPLKILFSFENPLPNREADAEVFTTTARYLAPRLARSWFQVPLRPGETAAATEALVGMPVLAAQAPASPGALRHLRCGTSIAAHPAFTEADLVYTRNFWVARCAVARGQRVVFDHYRPWPDQVPPMRRWVHQLMAHPRFLLKICHSEYTRNAYLRLGVAPEKLACIHNGYEPERFRERYVPAAARVAAGLEPEPFTIVYTGRINHKKGLDLVIEAARRLPQFRFVLVGATGASRLEAEAGAMPNIRLVPWQDEAGVGRYIQAADALLIPPSTRPLAEFGSTVLPLKLFLYLASERPIVAGATPDVLELLRHESNALLSTPDSVAGLVTNLQRLSAEPALGVRLAAAARRDSGSLTWDARAARIVAAIESRLDARTAAGGQWTGALQAQARRDSRRWLRHLVATRNWVLPPAFVAEAER